MPNNERDEEPVFLDMTDALRTTLRAVIGGTESAGQGVITTMIAAAAMQCYLREKVGPGAAHLIDATNRAIHSGMPYEKLVRFVQETIDDIVDELEPEPEAPPTRFYGQA